MHRSVDFVIWFSHLSILFGEYRWLVADGKTKNDKNTAKFNWHQTGIGHRGYRVQSRLFQCEYWVDFLIFHRSLFLCTEFSFVALELWAFFSIRRSIEKLFDTFFSLCCVIFVCFVSDFVRCALFLLLLKTWLVFTRGVKMQKHPIAMRLNAVCVHNLLTHFLILFFNFSRNTITNG